MIDSAVTRRGFIISAGSVTALGLIGCSSVAKPEVTSELAYATLQSRPGRRTENARIGLQPLGLELATGRDGFLYVPPSYSLDTPLPLLVLLHGAGGSSREWSAGPLSGLLDSQPIIVLAPDSRDRTWDLSLGGYGQDVRFIDDALALTFRTCNVDAERLALGGFSDGASYALSLGITNGNLFNALIAFSPGFFKPAAKRGRPRIYIGHGRQDQILPIETTRRAIVRTLRKDGYYVQFEEFEGRHRVTVEEATRALRWFTQR